MKNSRQSIMGACNWSIESLNNLRNGMADLGAPNHELNWAMGSMIVVLTSNLLKMTTDQLMESVKSPAMNRTMREDLITIRDQFSAFIDQMVDHE